MINQRIWDFTLVQSDRQNGNILLKPYLVSQLTFNLASTFQRIAHTTIVGFKYGFVSALGQKQTLSPYPGYVCFRG